MTPIKDIIVSNDGASSGVCRNEVLYLQSSVQDVLDLVEGFARRAQLCSPGAEENSPSEVPILESDRNRLVVGSVQVCALRRMALCYTRGAQVSVPSMQEVGRGFCNFQFTSFDIETNC